MLDKLIEEGLNLKSQIEVTEVYGVKSYNLSGEDFEKWASKVILYLEDHYPGKAITNKAIEVYNQLRNSSVENYEFLLGTIKGLQEYEREQDDDFDAF
ncbi:hypothetical protein FB379_11777 [Aeribacillus composti]|uniref:hypothetical protein n=1 Tax=Aeribacillus composti TaxID=1868734 RepID=UPI00119B4220|nr:hypothetical protein [Aeribacillus composti]TVZ81278.1 hypothetical protein FB379_11777 [Aeribacillus composti]